MSKAEKEPAAPKTKKAQKKDVVDPEVPLMLSWNLHELPSSQHRAGLAGLATCVEFLTRRQKRKGICKTKEISSTSFVLEVNRQGMQDLFDDIYQASIEQVAVKSKWAGVEPIETRDVEVKVKDPKNPGVEKTKTEKHFIYDKVVPAGELIKEQDRGSSEGKKLWLKLWQDFVWSALRGKSATREPYNARAEKRVSDDGGEAWDELSTNAHGSEPLPSTYAIGAQAQSADNVSMNDVRRFKFLLHFWPFCVSIYVPSVLQRDLKREFVGHAIAVPDVAVLDDFVDDWAQVWWRRSESRPGRRSESGPPLA